MSDDFKRQSERMGSTDRYEDILISRINLAKTEAEMKALLDKLFEYRKNNGTKEILEEFELRKEQTELEHQLRIKKYQAEGKTISAIWEQAFGDAESTFNTLNAGASKITSQLDSVIDKYAATMQSISGGLIGLQGEGGKTPLQTLTDKLQETLSTTSLVRQENVYNNLAKLVQAGIVGNVEQRAFLQTLADDIDLVFTGTNASLNRLINLYQTDITAERMAIEYNLKEFLNANYKTSQYITEAFESISDSLTEVIALNGGSTGLESTIQTWLGSYYSAGFASDTVSGLAKALNALGTGDISEIGSGISNLVLMGVARAGLDYGDLLNNSIDQSDVELIMTQIASYIGSLSGESNVVKSQLASIFGFNVADIIAAQNSTLGLSGLGVSTNISNMLDNYGELVPAVTGIKNTLNNMMYSWGTNIADDNTSYLMYEGSKLIGSTVGSILSGSGTKVGQIAGGLLQLAPLVTALAIGTGTIGDILSSGFSLTDFFSGSVGDLTSIYKSLGGTLSGGSFIMSSANVSGSAYYGDTGAGSMLEDINSSIGKVQTSTHTGEADKTTDDCIFNIDSNVLSILTYLNESLQATITSAIDNSANTSSSASGNYTDRSSRFGG